MVLKALSVFLPHFHVFIFFFVFIDILLIPAMMNIRVFLVFIIKEAMMNKISSPKTKHILALIALVLGVLLNGSSSFGSNINTELLSPFFLSVLFVLSLYLPWPTTNHIIHWFLIVTSLLRLTLIFIWLSKGVLEYFPTYSFFTFFLASIFPLLLVAAKKRWIKEKEDPLYQKVSPPKR